MAAFSDLKWWEIVFVPLIVAAGGAVKWLAGLGGERNKEDRALLSDEFSRLRQSNQDLADQLSGLTPTVTELRKEWAESVAREVALMEKLREQTAMSAQAQWERNQLKAALRLMAARISQLRSMIEEKTGIPLPPEADPMGILGMLDKQDRELEAEIESPVEAEQADLD